MDWRNVLVLEHLGSTLPLHIKNRVFSGFGLCLIFSVLVFYLLVPSGFSTDNNPGAKSLFSWVSSSFSNPGKQENHTTMIDENSNTTGGILERGYVLEKTHVRNLSGDGVVAGSDGKGVSRRASSSLSGNGGVEEKSNETIVLVAGNQTVYDAGNETESMEHGNISSGLDFRKKLEGDVGVSKRCDIFDGRWVRDRRKPFYTAGSCPYIDRDFNCHKNGRPDFEFLNWRWQPNDCDIPRLNATDFLKRLRGKRLAFVGDSLNRNMWESLICILRQSIPNKKSVSEISGRSQFKTKGFYSFKFKDYNCTIEYARSPFLVKESYGKGINGTHDEKLRLDLLDETAQAYREADIIVFNTGHWWTHEKTSRGVDYYQEGNYVHPVLKVMQAYDRALTTWAKWVDKNINANKTRVIYRGYSLTHFKGGQWNSGGHCHKETQPIFNDTFLAKYPSKMRLLEHVLKHMKTPVMYLNISRLTDYRKDGHPSIYRMKYKSVQEQIAAERSQDCSHWCLPGVPDTWNELLYASFLMDGKGSWRNSAGIV